MLNIVYCLNLAVNFKMKQISKLLLFSKRITKCLFFFFQWFLFCLPNLFFFYIFNVSYFYLSCRSDTFHQFFFFFCMHLQQDKISFSRLVFLFIYCICYDLNPEYSSFHFLFHVTIILKILFWLFSFPTQIFSISNFSSLFIFVGKNVFY